MMKKVLYGVAMAFVVLMSFGSLQSCKDDLSDLANQQKFDVSNLQDQINQNKRELLDSIRENRDSIHKLIGYLNKYATIKYVDSLYNEALRADTTGVDSLNNKINGAIKRINNHYDSIKNLEFRLDTVDSVNYSRWFQLKGKVESQEKSITAIRAQVKADSARIAKNEAQLKLDSARIANDSLRIDTLKGDVKTMKEELATAKANNDSLRKDVDSIYKRCVEFDKSINKLTKDLGLACDSIGKLDSIAKAHGKELGDMEAKYNALENRLANLFDKYDRLYTQVQKMITSLVLQAADSPVFGSLNTPLGIQSNFLFNWYGYNDTNIDDAKFPDYTGLTGIVNDPNAIVFTATDFRNLNPKQEDIPAGYYGNVELGSLYMTINPAGNFFNEKGFTLESSAENVYPVDLTVEKSKDELKFGYSRAVVQGNGFYKATATVNKDSIEKAQIKIESGLKSDLEDALKNPSKRTAIELLKVVYRQFNGKLPAYAVRYQWEAPDSTGKPQKYSVASKYEVAATTANPLSYNFLYGKGTNKKLPTFGALDNFIGKLKDNENLKFNFGTITFDKVNLQFDSITVGKINGNLSIKIPSVIVVSTQPGENYGQTIGKSEEKLIPSENIEGFDDLAKEIADSISSGVNRAMAGLNDDINEEIIGQIQSKVNQLIKDMNSEISGKIGNFISDLEKQADPYFDRVNRLIDLYNKVANKINGFLKNPNHYLQVAMFYNQADSNIGILSTKKSDPTRFKRANGNVGLYASSYTGELVCPAYMKYVAVTNVYKKDKNGKITVAGNADAERNKVNAAAETFNKVMPAGTIRYAIPASALTDKLIYEIVYQGLDYSGRTSTQKFYIQVN